jgi:hypothetical protein
METIGYKDGKRVELAVGKDYYNVFFAPNPKNSFVYNGGDSWTATKGGTAKTFDSPDTTAKALDYIIRHVETSLGVWE